MMKRLVAVFAITIVAFAAGPVGAGQAAETEDGLHLMLIRCNADGTVVCKGACTDSRYCC